MLTAEQHRRCVSVIGVLDKFNEGRGVTTDEKFAELAEETRVNGEFDVFDACHDIYDDTAEPP
jgi:hypothetical protein